MSEGDTPQSDYDQVFTPAIDKYKELTGQDLKIKLVTFKLNKVESTDDILSVFRQRMQNFDKSRDGNLNETLITWLESIVDLLFMISTKLEESTSDTYTTVRVICTAIVVLLEAAKGVDESYDSLLGLFERVQFFLQRINSFEVSQTTTIKPLWRVMAATLSIAAVFTETMTMREKRIKKILKGLVRRKELGNMQQLVDSLTEALDDVDSVLNVNRGEETRVDANEPERILEMLRSWLSPPDPSPRSNHVPASENRSGGITSWVTQDERFRSWKKKKGSLLWIRGKPGSGKTRICSAIIEDVKKSKSDLVAYYHFDPEDPTKCNLWGLLASLAIQLAEASARCRDVLLKIYNPNSSIQPSEGALEQCLTQMIKPQLQNRITIVLDGVDYQNMAPNPARGAILKLVDKLVRPTARSTQPNLYVCITSSSDLATTLGLLTPHPRRMILHEEDGQKEEIKSYVQSFIQRDEETRTWPEEVRVLVIKELSERANGIFGWVCQKLDTQRRGNTLARIRDNPKELGSALDETFEQTLRKIPEDKNQRAILLFQCLLAAPSNDPLRVNELEEIFTNPTDSEPGPAEEFMASTYSPFVSITDEKNPEVKFSSEWAKEFLTTDRLRTSHPDICRYHITLQSAHAVMAQVCLAALQRLTRNLHKTHQERGPLALYATRHWVYHAKLCNMDSQVQELMKRLFDSNEHLGAWLWTNDIDKDQCGTTHNPAHPSSPRVAPSSLYYAAFYGFSELVKHLAEMHEGDLEDTRGYHGTPLHAASYEGHIKTASVLIDKMKSIDILNKVHQSPLHAAYYGEKLESMKQLLEKKATVDTTDIVGNTLLHQASLDGRVQVVNLLLKYNPNLNAKNQNDWTPLHRAALRGHDEVVKILLDNEANVNPQSKNKNTPLHVASISGNLGVVKVLLKHEADVHKLGENNRTPYEAAIANGHDEIARLLRDYETP